MAPGASLGQAWAVASEALQRYRLRTGLSVLGVVLGVAAVIAMMSVTEGAALESLAQVEALGLQNLVARSRASSAASTSWHGLTAGDAERLARLVPDIRDVSPVAERVARVSRQGFSDSVRVLGVRSEYRDIVNLHLDRGRFIVPTDERHGSRVVVLGAGLSQRLFAFANPMGAALRIGSDYFLVVGVLGSVGGQAGTTGSMAWRDLNEAALVPLSSLTGRSVDVAPGQAADEVWAAVRHPDRTGVAAGLMRQVLTTAAGVPEFDLVVPRDLLAQRYRTQRTFSVVVGSVAALALLIGGIGVMNSLLTAVVERTREIGIRRTAGATRVDIRRQFLAEALLMTVSGGLAGIALGAVVSRGIAAYAGWTTHVSTLAVLLGFGVSVTVGVVFGLYPALKAAALEPVDAMRWE